MKVTSWWFTAKLLYVHIISGSSGKPLDTTSQYPAGGGCWWLWHSEANYMGEQRQPCLLCVVPAQNLLQKFIHSNVTGCSFLPWEVKTKQELKMECSEPSGSDAVPTRRAGNFSNPCCAGGGTKGSLSTLSASGWRYRRKAVRQFLCQRAFV